MARYSTNISRKGQRTKPWLLRAGSKAVIYAELFKSMNTNMISYSNQIKTLEDILNGSILLYQILEKTNYIDLT